MAVTEKMKQGGPERRFPGFKYLVIVGMGLILLIPLVMIRGLVDERHYRSLSVSEEIRSLWGGYQRLSGPYLAVPYRYRYLDAEGEERIGRREAYFLPEELDIRGELLPESRSRGIYSVSLFMAELELSGSFNFPDASKLGIAAEDLLFDEARLYLSLADPRGIRSAEGVSWNGTAVAPEPGTDPVEGSGAVWIPVDLNSSTRAESYPFELRLDLACGGSLMLVPAGRETRVELISSWPSPSYTGAYLPTAHELEDDGFRADWELSALGRAFPMSWTSAEPPVSTLSASAFGVEFFDPVNLYAKNERAVKYGLLFVLVPFLVFVLAELLTRIRIHPLQYLIAVSANLIFFLLLLSLSEHIPFYFAFLLAAGGSAGELFFYSRYALGSRGVAWSMLAASAGLYGFLYTALQSEDYALLIGSVGLFLILGLVMLLTGRIRWYG